MIALPRSSRVSQERGGGEGLHKPRSVEIYVGLGCWQEAQRGPVRAHEDSVLVYKPPVALSKHARCGIRGQARRGPTVAGFD